jgi:5-methyltetrahydrofolate--homocysteine methyltransferase
MSLLELLSEDRLLLLDGAMGTELASAGLEMGGQNCLSHPAAVLAVHTSYLDCGVDLLITNTLTMNRVYIETQHLTSEDGPIDVRKVNIAGARLARAAADGGKDKPVFVLGDLSPTGQMLAPLGPLTEAAAYAAYFEQATALLIGGVDGFLIETMYDLNEAVCALSACREVAAGLPALVSMSYRTAARGGRTLMGNTARMCAEVLEQEGAAAIGANCGDVTPQELAGIVETLRNTTHLPVLAQPNAGLPVLKGRRTVFEMAPKTFAEGMAQCLDAGARLVGGCCGTTPAHIRALAEVLEARIATGTG